MSDFDCTVDALYMTSTYSNLCVDWTCGLWVILSLNDSSGEICELLQLITWRGSFLFLEDLNGRIWTVLGELNGRNKPSNHIELYRAALSIVFFGRPEPNIPYARNIKVKCFEYFRSVTIFSRQLVFNKLSYNFSV